MNSTTWRQANVAFPDWERAEAVALAHLTPLIRAAEDEGDLTAWFIVRKRPCWRVRYLPAVDAQDRLGPGLDALVAERHISG
jgi:thiopeptide-type bacteriocin biosynthesis protein